ncbi:hypothetical protein QE430_001607 [Microbacterium testaceum]|jgi:hypothetical protein|uniref:hypothetical protein n=1 Tax=Microbacterium testaceum TaxID=2033 RepID=UPI00278369F6|nr:hypothetical protein [Microbacterium testaceum]MDQ1173300.1 hypothetical protein [Microbacterium testaceum]
MSPLARVGALGAAAAVVALALTACVPEAETGAANTSTPSADATTPAPVASSTPTPTPTPTATPTTALPASCDDIYSAAMRSTLEAQVPPLNDPGITLLSTDQAPLLELLAAVPTLRCTWGAPSDTGMATNVSVIDAAQAATVTGALTDAGFGCESSGDATICRIDQRGVSLDDKPYERGETQAVSPSTGLWISTSWINVNPDGYTEDILATLTR